MIINVVPVLNAVLARIGEASPEIFGAQVDLPTVSMDDLPEAAIERIEQATGRDIPDDFGQFTVFDAGQLRQVQDAVDLFDRTVVLAVVLAVVLVALALWVSPRRRRTLIQLCVGIALGIVLIRRLGLRLEDDVVDKVRPENQDAARVVVGAFVSSLLDATAWILGAAAPSPSSPSSVVPTRGPGPSGPGSPAAPGTWRRWSGRGSRARSTPAAQWVGRAPGDRPGRGDRGGHPRAAAGRPVVARGLLVLLALVAAVVVGVQRIADVTETGEAAEPAEGRPRGPAAGPAVEPR